ncbi:hypothetical protein [Ottowia sp.]|uniref:hypothetical protein n=1 Tax=Ottowia sp. TaxID=1898956 RepID=UPI002BDC5587|nr:hypothetical protein [Ottowia sp.]HPZ57557.1 hypothetical protein [Ottowia sp.]HQD49154.1 hypothetical protein [Ottowia sp.]
MKHAAVLSLLVLGIVGCASQPKPELTPEEYSQTAQQSNLLEECIASGHISSETGGRGIRYMQNYLRTKTYSASVLEAERTFWKKRPIEATGRTCNFLGAKINQIKDEPAYVQPTYNPEITRNRQTFCNKIGSQVFCSSF